ncbi:MAG TPA: carbohydrate ABC transporter permease [Desulfobacterales bacterium]|nr:carbohydrate ABC transporter permease [Desulfobacterales bacterium]
MESVKRVGLKIAHFGSLTIFALFASLPFLWMLITAFKQDADLYNRTNNPFIFNMAPTLDHLKYLFTETLFVKWLLNTAMVGVAVVAITLVLAVPAGYSLVRLGGRLGERLGIGIFLTYLVAPTILFIPMARVIARLGLQDSLWSLVLVFPTFTVPFAIWLLMGFFKAIPRELEEAAMIDGYSRLGAFVKMVLPISTSGILTVVIFSFTLVIQEYIYTLTFVTGASKYTVSVGVPTFLVHGDVYNWGGLMAGVLITAIPITIVYNFFVNRFIAGLTLGAVKG